MKNFSIVLILVLLMVLVVGCQQTSTRVGRAFIGGTEGLRTSFLGGNPPAAIFDSGSTTFSIVVKIENIGETTVGASDGYVQINGLDPQTYNTQVLKKTFPSDLPGAQMNFDGSVLNGGVATVDFDGLSYLPTVQGNIQQTVWADVCYKYQTKSTAQLCIKQNAEQLLGNQKICDVEGEKGPQNSGGPLQVTSLKENFGGNDKIGVTFIISHQGKGDNFFADTEDVCNDVETNNQRGKVHVLVHPIRLGGVDRFPACSGLSDKISDYEGYIRLFKDGSGREQFSLYCTFDTSGVTSIFQIPVDAELTYRYLQHIEQPLTIRHAIQ